VLEENESLPIIKAALNYGINFFDTADVYSIGASEEITGKALRAFAKRENVVIATKLFSQMSSDPNDVGLSRKHIFASVENSLRRLQTDYIDLYQIHRFDPNTPMEETMGALNDLVRCGKVRYIGASSMYAWQFAKMNWIADSHGWTRFVSMQNHYNLLYREEEREMIPYCVDENIGCLPWSPLARGVLAGTKTRDGKKQTPRAEQDGFTAQLYGGEDFNVVDVVNSLAQRKKISPAQLSLAWLLHKPTVVAPIIGVTKLKHLDEAVGALKVSLTEPEMEELEKPYRPHPVLGLFGPSTSPKKQKSRL